MGTFGSKMSNWDPDAAYAAAVHAANHKNGGSDEVATAAATANAIPKSGSGGKLDIGWLPLGVSSTTVVVGNDVRVPSSVESAAGQRVFHSPLPVAGTFVLISGTAYFVYLGRTLTSITPKFVEFCVTGAGSGAQTAEIGFFSTSAPPSKAAQSLTKLVSTNTVNALTGTGIIRNTSAFATAVNAGVHLWAGLRVAMATTQPTLRAINDDWGEGHIQTTAGAAALTGAGPWSGAIPTAATQITCPALRGTLD